MTLILDPTNTDDQAHFAQIKDLVGLADSVTDAQINTNALFSVAETEIVGYFPNASLSATGDGTGRDFPQRDQVESFVVFRASANFKRGGGNTGSNLSTTERSGTVKSESVSMGVVTTRKEFDVGSMARSSVVESAEDIADFFDEQADNILKSLGIEVEDTDLTAITVELA